MRIIAEYQSLMAAPDQAGPFRPVSKAPIQSRKTAGDAVMSAGPNRLGALLGTIALMLIALHVICAAMIIDRALAHAPEPITISQGD